MKKLALELDGALGDTRPLWRDWLKDAAQRFSMEELTDLPPDRARAAAVLDVQLTNWEVLLERFAQDHASVYLPRDAAVRGALRRLHGNGARLGVFTDAPPPLVRIALDQLEAGRHIEAVETGAGALERLLARLGEDAVVVTTRDDLVSAAA